MTQSMPDNQFDRELRRFLSDDARNVAGAPTARAMAARIAERTARPRLALTGRLVWIALVALLAAGLLGALVAGMLPQRDPAPVRYEAVFVRTELATPNRGDLLVFAIDLEGRERVLLRLPLRPGETGFPGLATVRQASLNRDGLLVTRRFDGGYHYVFEIVDVLRPAVPAVVVPGIRPDYDARFNPAYWGPDDRLAISWYAHPEQPSNRHLTFVDARTGATTTLPQPVVFEGVISDVPFSSLSSALRPYWTADGRGLVLGTTAEGMELLLRDGATVFARSDVFADGFARVYTANGDRLIADPTTLLSRLTGNGDREPIHAAPERLFDFAWASDGESTWMLLAEHEDRSVVLRRRNVSGEVVSIRLATPEAHDVWRPSGELLGLAPDDSLLAVNLSWEADDTPPGDPPSDLGLHLVAPATGDAIAVDGTFAGWLAVPD